MFCKDCGKELADNTLICPFCGSTMEKDFANVGAGAAQTSANKGKITVMVIALITVIALAILIVAATVTNGFGLLGKDTTKNAEESTAQNKIGNIDIVYT